MLYSKTTIPHMHPCRPHNTHDLRCRSSVRWTSSLPARFCLPRSYNPASATRITNTLAQGSQFIYRRLQPSIFENASHGLIQSGLVSNMSCVLHRSSYSARLTMCILASSTVCDVAVSAFGGTLPTMADTPSASAATDTVLLPSAFSSCAQGIV